MFRPGGRSTVASRVVSRGSDCGSNFNASLNTSFNVSFNSACDDIEAARPPSHRHAVPPVPPPPSLAATVGLRGAACACVCVLGVLALAGGGAPSRSAAAAASPSAEPRDLLKETRVLRRPAQVERLRRVYERAQGGGGGGGGGSKEEQREAAAAAEEDEELREEDDDDLGGGGGGSGGGGGGGGGAGAAVSNEAALAARRWSQQRQQEQSLRWVVRQSYPEWLGAHGAASAAAVGPAHRQSSREAASEGGGLLSEEGLALFRRWSEAYAAYSGAGGRRDLRLAVTFTNNAYIEEGLLPNLVCSLQRLGIQWYVIVATDEKAAAALARMGPEFAEHTHWDVGYWRGTASHALRLTYNSTEDYVAFIQRRTNFTKGLLETLHAQNERGRGKARSSTVEEVVVTDGDTVWMQDPLHAVAKVVEHLRAADKLRPGGGGHLKRLGCDGYAVNDVNHGAAATEKRLRTEPVGGFLVWKVNARVVRLYRRWVAMMRCLGSREQPALHAALSLMNAYVARPASWLNVHLAEKLHLRGPAAAQPVDLFLCTLPDFYFPTSLHLSMRATAAGPVSDYLSDYGLAAPREVARSLAVAHANIKYKSHDNKMTWFSQFHLNLWDHGKTACRARRGPAAPLAEPRFGREPAGKPLVGGKAQRMLYRGVAQAGRGLGWAKQEDGTWVQNMERYLEAHHSPWERWETCRVSNS